MSAAMGCEVIFHLIGMRIMESGNNSPFNEGIVDAISVKAFASVIGDEQGFAVVLRNGFSP